MNYQYSCQAILHRCSSRPWNEQWNTVWGKRKRIGLGNRA